MTLRWLVSGRVQGVGFRYFVLHRAVSLGLAGWTRNLPDGRVEVLAQGEADSLQALAQSLQEGPPRAGVVAVTREEISDEAALPNPFQVR